MSTHVHTYTHTHTHKHTHTHTFPHFSVSLSLCLSVSLLLLCFSPRLSLFFLSLSRSLPIPPSLLSHAGDHEAHDGQQVGLQRLPHTLLQKHSLKSNLSLCFSLSPSVSPCLAHSHSLSLSYPMQEIMKRMMANKFDFNDFLKQWQTMNNMGGTSIMKMIPGMNKVP
jgi:hypothetical protein